MAESNAMSQPQRQRSRKVSHEDREVFFSIISDPKFCEIITNKETNRSTNEQKLKAWKMITEIYNRRVTYSRTTAQLKAIFRQKGALQRRLRAENHVRKWKGVPLLPSGSSDRLSRYYDRSVAPMVNYDSSSAMFGGYGGEVGDIVESFQTPNQNVINDTRIASPVNQEEAMRPSYLDDDCGDMDQCLDNTSEGSSTESDNDTTDSSDQNPPIQSPGLERNEPRLSEFRSRDKERQRVRGAKRTAQEDAKLEVFQEIKRAARSQRICRKKESEWKVEKLKEEILLMRQKRLAASNVDSVDNRQQDGITSDSE